MIRCLLSNMAAVCFLFPAALCLLSGALTFPLNQENKRSTACGYQSCHPTNANMLNVHLVPHTHDDVGWLKTVDQYFYGARNDIQHAGVQYILDSVVDQLLKNPDRRFIYVETAFFYRWWKQQSSSMQETVKQLVNEGRLEFVNGGWCMSDEATTHYSAVIDQMTMGLRFLNETFGPCGRPRVAWHIDPFGHAREHASMFAQVKSLKADDFFPYADSAHDFWTGYFTSRPALKRYERISNSNLQTGTQREVLGGPASRSGPFGKGDSQTLKKAMAVAQHHDAVSGTEKQHVANDYARRLAKGWDNCQVLVSNSLAALSGSSSERSYCDNLNISVCPITESSKKFSVSVYNPLARPVTWPVRLPVNGSAYVISDASGKAVDCQIVPVSKATQDVRRSRGFAVNELVFQVQAPPLGFSTYSVSLLQDGPPRTAVQHDAPTVIQNKYLRVTFDPETGLLSSLSNLETKQSIKLRQNFYWYNASDGNNSDSIQPSGAYIFRPNSSTPFTVSPRAKTETLQTSVVQEVRQWFSPWISQVVRLYADSRALELEWTVGPLPISDSQGKEVITRLDTSIKTSEFFYTDSNGREVLQRRTNFRPTWNLRQSEPIAGNYYPVNSRAFIKDDEDQLTVVTDRSQGGGSIHNGSLELMLHRRLLYDDVRGVAEPLNETSEIFPEGLVVRGRLLLLLDRPSVAADAHRPLAQEVVLQPLLTFMKGELSPGTRLEFSGLQAALPPAVHLLTLTQWDADSVLLRLEHQFQSWESKVHSQPVTVNLQKLFSTLEVLGMSELNLSANQWKDEMIRLAWSPQSEEGPPLLKSFQDPSTWEVTLRPMEIRTFLLRVSLR
ncbi:lysosomal alpha-mannosidase [Cynoglossus semilaevis]|uniref:lysosomal alpha-mannosidase n=1 Tax=Cynoglossus semilaevis TaxID=244447 RepID=UPI0007DC867A|nr:lysosomal alpha-mannosidase-like [Cynoglossus semilaevis]